MQTNRLLLIIAVVAGVLATVLAFQYISSASGALEKTQTETQVPILFTKLDLPADHVIDPDVDLGVEMVGAKSSATLIRSALKSDELAAIRGQRIFAPVPAGMPLLYAHLAPVEDLKLGPGMRAISIQVEETSTFGGILVPGDHVDVIVSFRDVPPPAAPTGAIDGGDPMAAVNNVLSSVMGSTMSGSPQDWTAVEVLSNIRVVAVGDRLGRSRQQFPFAMPGAGPSSSNIVTLEVSPDQALALIQSQGGGQNPLRLLLRPPISGAASSTSGGALIEEG